MPVGAAEALRDRCTARSSRRRRRHRQPGKVLPGIRLRGRLDVVGGRLAATARLLVGQGVLVCRPVGKTRLCCTAASE